MNEFVETTVSADIKCAGSENEHQRSVSKHTSGHVVSDEDERSVNEQDTERVVPIKVLLESVGGTTDVTHSEENGNVNSETN